MEDIFEACMQGFANAFDACIDAKAICELGEEDFCSLLTRPDLRIKGEASLHRSIVCWLEHRSIEGDFRASERSAFECLAFYPHLFGTICSLFLRSDKAVHFMCSSHKLSFRLSTKNIVAYLRISEEFGFLDVTTLIEWTLCKNFEEFSATTAFTKLSSSQLKRLLARDDLVAANEATVLRSLITWLNAQTLDRASRQLMFEDLFALIRLLQIPANILHDILSEYSDCSTSAKCRELIQRAEQLASACSTSALQPEEALTATFSKKPRVYRDSGRPVLFVLCDLLSEEDQSLLVTYESKRNAWNITARIGCSDDAPVVGFGDSIYAFGDARSNNNVVIFTPGIGEFRRGSAAPEDEPCDHALVYDKKILVASTVNGSSLYEPLSDTWSEGPGCEFDLTISCLISVRERHVLALCTDTEDPKAFCWSPFVVEHGTIGSQAQAKNWTEMPFPDCQPSNVSGVEVNGRIFVVEMAFKGQSNQLAMFISVNDAHPDAWVPEGQWTVISEMSLHGTDCNMVLAAGDIYIMGEHKLDSDDTANAMVFLPMVEDRRPGKPPQRSSNAPMSSWRWWPLVNLKRSYYLIILTYSKENGGCIVVHKVVHAATIPFFREAFLHGSECAEFEDLQGLSPE
ncbi:hypothetical protein AAHC03_013820 [Spirometra sp. Aus1]